MTAPARRWTSSRTVRPCSALGAGDAGDAAYAPRLAKQGGPAENPVRKLRARTLEALGGTACLFDAASGSYRPVPGTP